MDVKEMLKDITVKPAVSGFEASLCENMRASFAEYCDSVEVDRFYNVIGIKKGAGSGRKKIMITAHYDEIGFIVKSIDENGFVKLSNMGGIDAKILLAQEVTIHGKKDILGILGAKPPHLLKPDDARQAVKLSDLSVDTGMPSEQVKALVSIGDTVTFLAPPVELQNEKMASKSMDNKSSVIAMVEAMKYLQRVKYDWDVYFVATTQEEIGSRGAVVSSANIVPDMAVVIDVGHGDMPDAPKDQTFPLGKGPAISIGPNLHRKITRRMMDAAKENNIPYHVEPVPESTGTDAWVTQVSGVGIPTILLSIPLKYMHTTIETLSIKDVKLTGRLAGVFAAGLEGEMEDVLCY